MRRTGASGQHIMRRGASVRRGEAVFEAGRVLRPVDVGLLCEIGCAEVTVRRRRASAILATGNELVPPRQRPAAGEIRNSNGPMLCALARSEQGQVVDLGIARDEIPSRCDMPSSKDSSCDVLVLSGGVSAGVLDLVPGVLEQLGVEHACFIKVHLKPGKPSLVRRPRGGLPEDARVRTAGQSGGDPGVFRAVRGTRAAADAGARLKSWQSPGSRDSHGDHHHRSDRPTFCPACITRTATR